MGNRTLCLEQPVPDQKCLRLLAGPSRYRQWADCAGSALGGLVGREFNDDDIDLALAWGSVQKRDWGWSLEVRSGISGKPCLLAFSGSESSDVEWLIYRCENGYQSDEWCNFSRWSPTLRAALTLIAPFPEEVVEINAVRYIV